MALKLEAFFELMLFWTQRLESANNHLNLDVLERWKQLSPHNIKELTKRYPNFSEDMENSFFKIQDAIDPLNKIVCEVEELLAEHEKTAA